MTFGTRDSKHSIEQGLVFAPKFDEHGLIPVVAIDVHTNEPLMLAYMSEESLKQTLQIGQAVYWSRSRQELWHKGKTSGQIQRVVELRTDCDQDAIVMKVEQLGGGCCHTGANECFYRSIPFGNALPAGDGPVPLLRR